MDWIPLTYHREIWHPCLGKSHLITEDVVSERRTTGIGLLSYLATWWRVHPNQRPPTCRLHLSYYSHGLRSTPQMIQPERTDENNISYLRWPNHSTGALRGASQAVPAWKLLLGSTCYWGNIWRLARVTDTDKPWFGLVTNTWNGITVNERCAAM